MVSFWRHVIVALFSLVQVEWQHPSVAYYVIRFRVRGCEDFRTEPNKPHPRTDIYRAFGFSIITIEWVVWLRNDFAGVILTRADTFQPISSQIRKIIKQSIIVNAPVVHTIISKLNCVWPITNPIKHKQWQTPYQLTVPSRSTRNWNIPLNCSGESDGRMARRQWQANPLLKYISKINIKLSKVNIGQDSDSVTELLSR